MAKREGTPKHIHTYVRVSGRFVRVWKCADPDCKFLVNQTQEYHVLGKSSFCRGCGAKFVMDEDAMQMDLPECAACRNPDIATLVPNMDKAKPLALTPEFLAKMEEMGIKHD